MPDNYW